MLFAIAVASFHVPTNSAKSSSFSMFANSKYVLFFYGNYSNGYKVIYHCGFDLHFPNDLRC